MIKNGNEEIIAFEEVKINDILRVLSKETITIDGIIVHGETSIDQAIMMSESLPVDKTVGDNVSSETVNRFATFDMKASKVGEDSSVQRMIKLVQSADASKTKIVTLSGRFATWIITSQVIRTVIILVDFCPIALVLATPTAIMAAIGNVTKHGFLVREGDVFSIDKSLYIKNSSYKNYDGVIMMR